MVKYLGMGELQYGLGSLSKLVLVLLFFMNTRSVENSAFENIVEIFRCKWIIIIIIIISSFFGRC